MTTVTERPRDSGIWGIRHSCARVPHVCFDCGRTILPGETCWRYFGKMGDSPRAWMAFMCESCVRS